MFGAARYHVNAMKYVHKILNNCEEVSLMALQAKEQKLPWRKRVELKIHLFYCRCCSNFVKQSDLIDKTLGHLAENMDKNPPFQADEKFKAKLKDKIK